MELLISISSNLSFFLCSLFSCRHCIIPFRKERTPPYILNFIFCFSTATAVWFLLASQWACSTSSGSRCFGAAILASKRVCATSSLSCCLAAAVWLFLASKQVYCTSSVYRYLAVAVLSKGKRACRTSSLSCYLTAAVWFLFARNKLDVRYLFLLMTFVLFCFVFSCSLKKTFQIFFVRHYLFKILTPPVFK